MRRPSIFTLGLYLQPLFTLFPVTFSDSLEEKTKFCYIGLTKTEKDVTFYEM